MDRRDFESPSPSVLRMYLYLHACTPSPIPPPHLVHADRGPLDCPLGEPNRQLRLGPVCGAPPFLGELVVREATVDPLVVAVVHETVVECPDQPAAGHSPELQPDLWNVCNTAICLSWYHTLSVYCICTSQYIMYIYFSYILAICLFVMVSYKRYCISVLGVCICTSQCITYIFFQMYWQCVCYGIIWYYTSVLCLCVCTSILRIYTFICTGNSVCCGIALYDISRILRTYAYYIHHIQKK